MPAHLLNRRGTANEQLRPLRSTHERTEVRRAAVLALREASGCKSETLEWLYHRLEQDPDDSVRSNAAYTLGIFARDQTNKFGGFERLIVHLGHDVEPDNTNNGGMNRSTVRKNVAFALTMVRLTILEIEQVLAFAINEHDRYAKSFLSIAIQRSARYVTDSWVSTLVDYLTPNVLLPDDGTWRTRQDSNLWPFAPEANALSN